VQSQGQGLQRQIVQGQGERGKWLQSQEVPHQGGKMNEKFEYNTYIYESDKDTLDEGK
jgi:hypothetical protein